MSEIQGVARFKFHEGKVEEFKRLCAQVMDVVRAKDIEAETERMQHAMREASELALPGFPLKTDAKIVRHPDRYSDPRGERMWAVVGRLLDAPTPRTGAATPPAPVRPPPSLISVSHGIT